MRLVAQYYQLLDLPCSFTIFLEQNKNDFSLAEEKIRQLAAVLRRRVMIVAYCIMPTHIHFILRQEEDNGIMDFMRLIQNSQACYFNLKYKRRGPLWEGRFGGRIMADTGDMLSETRYVHLNPTTAYLVDRPETWKFSSYNEYVGHVEKAKGICDWEEWLDFKVA